MKRAWIVAVVLVTGCDSKKVERCPNCPPDGPARTVARPAGVVLTGLPESPDLAACDSRGRWGVKDPVIEHSIVDSKEKDPLLAAESNPRLSLYRDWLPFPQVNWKSGDWEVTQLVFPVAKGFVARYHVMNHGENARTGQLKIGGPGMTLATAGQAPAASLTFDLKVDPGVSQFFTVTTADLAGKVADDALDQATAQWEKLIGNRGLKLPDAFVATEYYANLAGLILGVSGCADAAATTILPRSQLQARRTPVPDTSSIGDRIG